MTEMRSARAPGFSRGKAELHIRTRWDDPHRRSRYLPAVTACGQPLRDAARITAAQALVWLDNRRCRWCFPRHIHRGGAA